MPLAYTSSPPHPPSKRPWFRYSLRTMLLVVTVLGLWLGWKFSEAREQRKTVAELSAAGMQVYYDFDNLGQVPQKPEWLIDMLGVDFFHDVVFVRNKSLDNWTAKPDARAALPILARLPELTRIMCVETALSDEDLQLLAPLEELEELTEYVRCTATGVGFKGWRSRDTIRSIFLHDSPITDAGMQEIKEFKNLDMLWLLNSRVTDESVEAIASMPKLTDVYLEGSNVTPEGARRLQELRPGLTCDLFPSPESSQ